MGDAREEIDGYWIPVPPQSGMFCIFEAGHRLAGSYRVIAMRDVPDGPDPRWALRSIFLDENGQQRPPIIIHADDALAATWGFS